MSAARIFEVSPAWLPLLPGVVLAVLVIVVVVWVRRAR